MIQFAEQYGGIGRAREKAEDFIAKARHELDEIVDSDSKESLLNLTDFAVERVH